MSEIGKVAALLSARAACREHAGGFVLQWDSGCNRGCDHWLLLLSTVGQQKHISLGLGSTCFAPLPVAAALSNDCDGVCDVLSCCVIEAAFHVLLACLSAFPCLEHLIFPVTVIPR